MRDYTTNQGIVHQRALLDNVSEHDSGKDYAYSNVQQIAGAKAVSFQFSGKGMTSGSGEISIQVTMDGGDTWHQYGMLIEHTPNSDSESLTRVVSKTISDDMSYLFFMSPETLGGITHIRARVEIDTDGEYSVKANIAY